MYKSLVKQDTYTPHLSNASNCYSLIPEKHFLHSFPTTFFDIVILVMHLLDVLERAFINKNIFFLHQVESQYATVNIKSMFIKSVIFIVKTLGLLKLKM